MSTSRAASPYGGIDFDFGVYEVEVEKGRQRILTILLLNMLLVLGNISANLWLLDKITDLVVKIVQIQLQVQQIPDPEKIMKQMLEVLSTPTYPTYVMVSQLALFLIIAVLPWVAIYLGKQWARGIVGIVALLQGITAVLLGPLLIWYGLYSIALLCIAFGGLKLYTVGVLFMVPSVKKFFNHANL